MAVSGDADDVENDDLRIYSLTLFGKPACAPSDASGTKDKCSGRIKSARFKLSNSAKTDESSRKFLPYSLEQL